MVTCSTPRSSNRCRAAVRMRCRLAAASALSRSSHVSLVRLGHAAWAVTERECSTKPLQSGRERRYGVLSYKRTAVHILTRGLPRSSEMEGITNPMDTALLILRLVVGLYVTAHGAQKLFGWCEGHGFSKTQGFVGGMLGYRPAWLWTLAVSLAEFVGGLLFVLG